jgi:hypothetical protein
MTTLYRIDQQKELKEYKSCPEEKYDFQPSDSRVSFLMFGRFEKFTELCWRNIVYKACKDLDVDLIDPTFKDLNTKNKNLFNDCYNRHIDKTANYIFYFDRFNYTDLVIDLAQVCSLYPSKPKFVFLSTSSPVFNDVMDVLSNKSNYVLKYLNENDYYDIQSMANTVCNWISSGANESEMIFKRVGLFGDSNKILKYRDYFSILFNKSQTRFHINPPSNYEFTCKIIYFENYIDTNALNALYDYNKNTYLFIYLPRNINYKDKIIHYLNNNDIQYKIIKTSIEKANKIIYEYIREYLMTDNKI